jgi:DNA-binding MarR family transcriptional regulator
MNHCNSTQEEMQHDGWRNQAAQKSVMMHNSSRLRKFSDAAHAARANLAAAIDALESLGLARRDVSATDRRSNRLHLTPAAACIADSARYPGRA